MQHELAVSQSLVEFPLLCKNSLFLTSPTSPAWNLKGARLWSLRGEPLPLGRFFKALDISLQAVWVLKPILSEGMP